MAGRKVTRRGTRRLKRNSRKSRRRIGRGKLRKQRGGDGSTAIPQGYGERMVVDGPPEGADRLGESYTEPEPIDGLVNPRPTL
jgi:hypothetical protein